MFTCLAHQGWHITATTSVCKERFGGMAAAGVGRLERSDSPSIVGTALRSAAFRSRSFGM